MADSGTDQHGGLSRHRFATTLIVAVALHGALSYLPGRHPRSNPGAPRDIVELELASDESANPEERRDTLEPTSTASPGIPSRAVHVAGPAPLADQPSPLPTTQDVGADSSAGASDHETVAAPRAAVDLFLGRKALAELVRKPPPREAPPGASVVRRPAVDLEESLGTAGADPGLTASSPAVSASYRSAELGPDVGTALLELRTDTSGAVVSVKVLGSGGSSRWALVAGDLLARLKEHLLRVPAGARGLVTRLRIDRGALAEDLAGRGHLERGVALGQDHHPRDFGVDESTQAAGTRGRLTPSLGVSSEALRKTVKTRVRVVSEQPL